MVWADSLEDWLQFAVILFLWCTLYFSIKQWQQSVRERERLVRAESEAREARLSALRYQLNPHFLFNSLNATSTLVLQGKAAPRRRACLPRSVSFSELRSTMTLLQRYRFRRNWPS